MLQGFHNPGGVPGTGAPLLAPDCAELMRQLEAGGDAARAAIDAVRGQVLALTFDPAGCRVVQQALEIASRCESAALALELCYHVRKAIASPHGNYVIQKCVEVLPAASRAFITEELVGAGAQVARHRFGCRIICRLIEHFSGGQHDAGLEQLLDEILEEAAELCRHSFGHHAVQAILEHGTAEQQHRIAAAVAGDLPRNAKNRNASHVIEKVLESGSVKDREAVALELARDAAELQQLAQHRFGGYVVQTLLRQRGVLPQAASDRVQARGWAIDGVSTEPARATFSRRGHINW